MQVIESQSIRNFERVMPEVQPAREEPSPIHITVASLRELLKLLRESAEGTRIPSKKLVMLVKHLVVQM